MTRLLLLALLFGCALWPATGVDGKWTAEAPSRDGGKETVTFEFQTTGGKVTGMVRMPGREDEVREGAINGATLSFVLVIDMGGREMRLKHTGTIEGDEIRFVRELEGLGRRAEFVARRTP